MLLEMTEMQFRFLNSVPVEEKLQYSVSSNFHIIVGKQKRLINNKFTPLILSKNGSIRIGLCLLSLAVENKPGYMLLKKQAASTYFEYSISTHRWEERQEVVLTEHERNVLYLTAQGYTMDKISEYLCRSIDTVKGYKRSIFEKMNVKNIAEAITYAQNHQLI